MAVRRLNTKNHILEKARKLFAKQGFEATSMSDIAKHVGIEKASLYYFFENKEQLFGEIIEQSWAGLNADPKSHPEAAGNPKENLARALEHIIEVSCKTGLAMLKLDRHHFEYCRGAFKHITEMRNRLLKFLEDCKIPQPKVAEQLIVNSIRGYIIEAQIQHPSVSVKTYSKYIVNLIFSN